MPDYPLLKTEWEKITVRFPSSWAKRLHEISGMTGNSEAHLIRECTQLGLPVLLAEWERRREWVSRKIHPQGSRAKSRRRR